MPMDRSRYPADWDSISRSIRDRAGHKCEWCGVPNDALILRSKVDGSKYLILNKDGEFHDNEGHAVRLSEEPEQYHDAQYTRVVLTVAHLGVDKPDGVPGDKHDKMDCRPENLAALCQRCHLGFDMEDHIAARRRNRLQKKAEAIREAGQQSLF